MRLAKSQAHQPFPGFFKPGFLLSNHRCKSLFQGVCPDSNRAFSFSGRCVQPAPLFERRFFRLAAVFFSKKESQRFGRRFVGLDGPRERRPFFISKRALVAAPAFVGRSMIAPALFFCMHGRSYMSISAEEKELLPQRSSNRPCPRRVSTDRTSSHWQAVCPA